MSPKEVPSNAVLANDIAYIKESLVDIKNTLERIHSQFMTRDELNKVQLANDKIHDDHEVRIRRVERWGSVAIGGAYIVQLVLQYTLK